ncbi:MAG TPA: dihydrofolate reductase family protein [Rhodothermales bacterium]|nr:dihydrofolate reductase family protein [Rhodothermales bacterium]
MGEDLTQRLNGAAAMVLGRKTYDEFAEFWPRQGSDVPFADLNNQVRKFVVSRTLTDATWHNSTVVDAEALVHLRSEGDLHVTGSRQLVLSLLEMGLLDEIVLMMCPVVLGEGQRLFEGIHHVEMERLDTVPFPKGVLCLKLWPV